MKNLFSIKNIIEGVIITVIGGIILTFILQGAIGSSQEPPMVPPTTENSQTGGQVQPIVTSPPPPTEDTACQKAPLKRLNVGSAAVVCTANDAVILRSGPHRAATTIDKLPTGTRLMVIGGPTCDDRTSWWYWEVQTASGVSGWVAEGGDEVDPYFICPSN